MSMINNELITWFDHFPNEIIFMIFNYLSNNDILYTFFFFNQRLNKLLLQNRKYLNCLVSPRKNLNIWENIFSIIGFHIETLKINTIDSFIPLIYFNNLKSIIISSSYGFPEEKLKSIIENNIFLKLHLFKIQEEDIYFDRINDTYISNQNYLYEKIFNNKSSLRIFQYSLSIPSFSRSYLNTFQTNYNLHSLTLILYHFEDIFSLLSYTPNLKYLSIKSHPPYIFQTSFNKIDIELKEFYLTLNYHIKLQNQHFSGQPNFNQLINSIQQFSLTLNCLSLNLIDLNIRNDDEFPFNSIRLQQLLEPMIELKQFHLYAKLNNDQINSDEILSRFKQKFWFEKNYLFGMHGKYFYTLPFHFNYLHQFFNDFNYIKYSNPEILMNNSRLWYHVKSIELNKSSIKDLNFIKQLKIQMPKLNSIKFIRYRSSLINRKDNDLNEIKQINVSLDNVTTVYFSYEIIENLKQWFIHILPNLNHLILSSSINNELNSLSNKKNSTIGY